MASYSSYKANRIPGSQIQAGAIDNTKIAIGARGTYGVKWVYGSPSNCTGGCCCLWTVPANTQRLTVEAWGAGGNGHGACSYNRCQHYMGAGGGNYNTVGVTTAPGCQYTVCAGGVHPCNSVEQTACNGCTSYMNGYNMSNFCACGGSAGCSNGSWTDGCFSYMDNCAYPGIGGGEFSANTMPGAWTMAGPYTYPGDACHCWKRMNNSTAAFGLNTGRNQHHLAECWMRCGCWTVPPGSGAIGAMTTYCGSDGCCGQGGTGGTGVVKITYY